MAIPVLSVSSSAEMAAAGLLLGQARNSQTAQAQASSVPDPSVIVTLGAGAPTPLTYDAAGVLAGLDSTTVTASVMDAIAILQNTPSGSATEALNSLLGANLGVTASALNTGATDAVALASTTLLSNPPAGADTISQTFAGLLAGQAQLLAAGFDAGASGSGGIDGTGVLQTTLINSTTQALSDLATADANLATAAMGAGTETGGATAATVAVASALGQIQNFPAESASQAVNAASAVSAVPTEGLPVAAIAEPTTGLNAAAITPQVNGTSSVTAGQAVAPTISAPPAAAANNAGNTGATAAGFYNANAVLQGLLAEAAVRALSTLATDPAYAAGAAALYASAGLFSSRLNDSQHLLPQVSSVIQPVLPIRGIGQVAAA